MNQGRKEQKKEGRKKKEVKEKTLNVERKKERCMESYELFVEGGRIRKYKK